MPCRTGTLPPLAPLNKGGIEGVMTLRFKKLRTALFGDSKSHGGLFKKLIDETDKLLYALIKMQSI